MQVQSFFQQIRKSLVAVGLVCSLAAPAAAGTLYSWTTEEGTIAFTDDAKRIPARYRDVAKRRQVGGLEASKVYCPPRTGHTKWLKDLGPLLTSPKTRRTPHAPPGSLALVVDDQ